MGGDTRIAAPARLERVVDLMPTRSASLEVECFALMANGLFHHSLGQRPRSTENTVSLGQGPCSIGHVSVEYGRWPNRFFSLSVPGALPLATINMAFGQQTQTRNFKKSQRGSRSHNSSRSILHGRKHYRLIPRQEMWVRMSPAERTYSRRSP